MQNNGKFEDMSLGNDLKAMKTKDFSDKGVPIVPHRLLAKELDWSKRQELMDCVFLETLQEEVLQWHCWPVLSLAEFMSLLIA